jgi:DNA-binding PadR family transcriptional regulator
MSDAGLREFLRGAVRLHILHHGSRGEIHGAWLSEELVEHGYRISPGTLYPTLHRMEAEGLLISRQIVTDGKSLRVYKTTSAGRRALRESKKALKELADELL